MADMRYWWCYLVHWYLRLRYFGKFRCGIAVFYNVWQLFVMTGVFAQSRSSSLRSLLRMPDRWSRGTETLGALRLAFCLNIDNRGKPYPCLSMLRLRRLGRIKTISQVFNELENIKYQTMEKCYFSEGLKFKLAINIVCLHHWFIVAFRCKRNSRESSGKSKTLGNSLIAWYH